MAAAKEPVKQRKAPHYAATGEVQAFASDLPDNFLLCREIGHNWRPYGAQWVPEDNCYQRTLRCTRCRTLRNQAISARGEIAQSGYDYPEGYQHKGLGRIIGDGRNTLRLESIVRLVGDKTEVEE